MPFAKRIFAYLIDLVVLMQLCCVLFLFSGKILGSLPEFILSNIYFFAPLTIFNASFGSFICKTRIINTDGSKCGFFKIALWSSLFVFIPLITLINFIMYKTYNMNQFLHDKIMRIAYIEDDRNLFSFVARFLALVAVVASLAMPIMSNWNYIYKGVLKSLDEIDKEDEQMKTRVMEMKRQRVGGVEVDRRTIAQPIK